MSTAIATAARRPEAPLARPSKPPTKPSKNGKAHLERLNARLIAMRSFAEDLRLKMTATVDGAPDGGPLHRFAVAGLEHFGAIETAAAKASTTLFELTKAGWAPPKPRRKDDHRVGDKVAFRKQRLDALVKAGAYKREDVANLTISAVYGGFVEVSKPGSAPGSTHLVGVFASPWLSRKDG